jgi:hypothetical protein
LFIAEIVAAGGVLYFLIAGAFAVMAVTRPKRAPYFNAIAILAIELAIGTALLFAVTPGGWLLLRAMPYVALMDWLVYPWLLLFLLGCRALARVRLAGS